MITARMPVESRDRLSRPVDIAAAFARWRSGIRSDEFPGDSSLFESWNRQRRPTTSVVSQGQIQIGTGTQIQGRVVVGGGSGRGSVRTPRVGSTSRLRRMYSTALPRRENTPLGASGRRLGSRSGGRSTSPLPSWYPRTPMADITAVVRAYEIRRSRLRGEQSHTQDRPVPPSQGVLNTTSFLRNGAPPELNPAFCTPASRVRTKPCQSSFGKVRRILLDVTNQPDYGDPEFLTPQRKLLNQIDTVQKVVMEELRKLERTPSAKKAQRQERARTLMSMR